MEMEPDWSQCGQTCAHDRERQFDVCPEEDTCGVVNDIVRVFDVFLSDRVYGNDASNAHSAYTG